MGKNEKPATAFASPSGEDGGAKQRASRASHHLKATFYLIDLPFLGLEFLKISSSGSNTSERPSKLGEVTYTKLA